MARRAAKAAEPEPVDLDHPRFASAVLGVEAPEAHFLDAYNANRLHHAWLLHGPKGIGKATFAYRAARFLLAEEKTEAGGLFGAAALPTNLDRPSDDPACRRVAAGSHSDLFTLEPERAGGQIPADSARRLIQSFRLTAGEGAWRVAVIDAADDLNRYAANILLKLIEEPPKRTAIFLVSHNPGRLLPTIRSRCSRLAFTPLTDEDVARIVAARRLKAGADEIAAALALAAGSPGRALALVDGGGGAVADGLAKALAGRRGAGTLAAEAFAGQIAKNPFHVQLAGEMLLGWLAAAARPDDAPTVAGMTEALSAEAGGARRLGPKPWLDLYDHARQRLERARAVNLDPAQTLVDILARAQALLVRASP